MRHDHRLIHQFLTEISLLQYAACCYRVLVEHPDYSLPLPPPEVKIGECTDATLESRILNMHKYLTANPCDHVSVAFNHLIQRIENSSK